MESLDLRLVRPSTFEPLLGTVFTAADAASTFVLVAVESSGGQPNAPRSEPFAVVFTGPAGLEQRIYDLRHAVLGRVDIFLVAIGPDADGRHRYEAVFN